MPPDTNDLNEPIEECIEAFDEFIMSLERHPPQAVAQAMGSHLEALLRAMLAAGDCTVRDARDFLREIARGALQ